MKAYPTCRACFTEVRCAELGRCLDATSVLKSSEPLPMQGVDAVATGSPAAEVLTGCTREGAEAALSQNLRFNDERNRLFLGENWMADMRAPVSQQENTNHEPRS